mmetsp:Transcript_29633/g.71645  ORF Transcript_29633/g.71645 Transcript_29633/m.71645 type:complete len:231 (-) Transcript_29633:46-738(-)
MYRAMPPRCRASMYTSPSSAMMYSIRSVLYRRNSASKYCRFTATPTYSTMKSYFLHGSWTISPRPLRPASNTLSFFHCRRCMRLFPQSGPAAQFVPHSSWHAKRAQDVSTQVWSCSVRSGSQKHRSGRTKRGRAALARLVTAEQRGGCCCPAAAVVEEVLLLLCPPRGWCVAAGASSAHSTSEMCSTSDGSAMGRLGMMAPSSLEEFVQWSEVVYAASVMISSLGRSGCC